MRPAGVIEGFERLVGEIKNVADLDIAMISSSGKEHIRKLLGTGPSARRRHKTTLGPFRIAHLDELPEPALKRRRVRYGTWQRLHAEARRHPGAIAGHRCEAMIRRPRPVARIQEG